MKMRTEKQIYDTILNFAKADDRIRVVTLEGSRTNINIIPDDFQDYDITFFVTDMQSFINSDEWLNVFGERLIMQKPEDKVKMTYNALKKWHKSHMKLYDMIIDPISSPKAIDSTGEKSFYNLYYQLKLKDLDFMKMVLDNVERGITEEELNEKVLTQIRSNSDFYSSINRSGQALCEKYNLNYDGKENPFIR